LRKGPGQSTNQALSELLAEAEMALSEGSPADAESFCRDVLAADPLQAQALFLLAEALRLQGRYPEAELNYKRCVLSLPEHADAWAALSSIFFEDLRWDEARRTCNRALREDLWSGEASFVRGALRERRGDYAGAFRDFTRAWRSDPQAWPLPTHLSDEALESVVEEAIHKLHPSVQEYLANVAIILEDLPTDEVLAGYDPPASPTGLLGYFSGYSLSERSVETPWSNLPSAIVIYRRNIERLSSSREELVEQVGLTVFHEVGHLLGLDFELTQGAKE
jgi:predicted Zn-dependent protease with MMP-like domain